MTVLDWAGMLRLGLGRLRLRPAEFWDLTPQEFLLLLGPQAAAPSLGRAGLAELMQRFPDVRNPDTAADDKRSTGPAGAGTRC